MNNIHLRNKDAEQWVLTVFARCIILASVVAIIIYAIKGLKVPTWYYLPPLLMTLDAGVRLTYRFKWEKAHNEALYILRILGKDATMKSCVLNHMHVVDRENPQSELYSLNVLQLNWLIEKANHELMTRRVDRFWHASWREIKAAADEAEERLNLLRKNSGNIVFQT